MLWDIVISLLVAFFGGSILIYIGASIWFRIRWAQGWRPFIFDEKTVEETVEEYSHVLHDWSISQAEEHGATYSDAERKERSAMMKLQLRWFIERYIENLSFSGRK